MNWQAIRFDWNQARAFLVTAETGSFSAAARALALTQPTLGRQVAALEEALGVTLFERIGRKLELTPAGRDLLDHVRGMGETAARLSLSASGHAQDISGPVCVSVTDIFAAFVMPHVIAELQEIAPLIVIEVLASNTLSDIQRREADIAVRHVRPEQPDLIARKIRDSAGRLYASSAYLQRIGRPQRPEDLLDATFIGLGDNAEMLRFLNGVMGLTLGERNFRLASENGIVAWQMVRVGLGVGAMTEDLARITSGVECVLPQLTPVPVPYWLTTHRDLHTSRRIRLVYDLMADVLNRPVLPGQVG